MSEGVVVQDRTGRILDANPAAELILGLTRDQMLGRTSMDPAWRAVREDGTLFPGEDHPAMVTLRTGMPTRERVMGIRYGSDEPRWISINAQPLPDTGNPAGEAVLTTFVDVTARKRTERDLRKALQQKDLLLRELHHRVKNNLATASALLSLQARLSREPALSEKLLEAQGRLKSIALVHEYFYGGGNLRDIEALAYLRRLVMDIVASLDDRATQIQVRVEGDPVRLDIEHAMPCGLIVNELVTNAFKNAWPKGGPGRLSVSIQHLDDAGKLRLRVCDDGRGMDASPMGADGSFGCEIVRLLVQQLDGHIEWRSGDLAPGTEVLVEFQQESRQGSG